MNTTSSSQSILSSDKSPTVNDLNGDTRPSSSEPSRPLSAASTGDQPLKIPSNPVPVHPIIQGRVTKCLNCSNKSRPGSKFCSRACGLAHFKETLSAQKREEIEAKKLARFKLRMEKVWKDIMTDIDGGKTVSTTESDDYNCLKEVQNKRKIAQVQMDSATERESEVNQLVLEAAHLDPVHQPSVHFKHTHIDCPICGAPSQSHITSHMPGCYYKTESNMPVTGYFPHPAGDLSCPVYCDFYDPKSGYCKKLKASCYLHAGLVSRVRKPQQSLDSACGCPTESDSSGKCLLPKSQCIRHYNWESIWKCEAMLNKATAKQLLDALEYEEMDVKDRMIMRRLSRKLGQNIQVIQELEPT